MNPQKPQLRISPTLLDSFFYYLSIDDEEQCRQKRQELINYLNGIKTTSEAMENGKAFEDDVLACVQGRPLMTADQKIIACAEEIAAIVKGGTSQYHVERELDGISLHGYEDWLKRNVIYDIKTTSKYEIGKYNHKNQHRIYLYCMQPLKIDRFVYLVTDFKTVYREDYVWLPRYEEDLRANVRAWFDYLENDPEMKRAYMDKMSRKEAA